MISTFERALSAFPHLSPTALSIDPYVIQFENLLDSAEAKALIGACDGLQETYKLINFKDIKIIIDLLLKIRDFVMRALFLLLFDLSCLKTSQKKI